MQKNIFSVPLLLMNSELDLIYQQTKELRGKKRQKRG